MCVQADTGDEYNDGLWKRNQYMLRFVPWVEVLPQIQRKSAHTLKFTHNKRKSTQFDMTVLVG